MNKIKSTSTNEICPLCKDLLSQRNEELYECSTCGLWKNDNGELQKRNEWEQFYEMKRNKGGGGTEFNVKEYEEFLSRTDWTPVEKGVKQ